MVGESERCAVCGRAVERNGRAKAYVHANQFHQRVGHQAVVERRAIRVLAPVAGPSRVIDLREVREAERVTA